ncbi:MAG: von Willebrand factor type A domain-containing protein, partial [Myxococcales bacterium]|nr:von Willebrand factor type A domain-containing protein [Myxococcales bacterium]
TTVRSLLKAGVLPPPNRVRIEEMLNYFRYSYPSPPDKAFGFMADTVRAPWAADRRLVRIGIKGRELTDSARPPSNLVLLIDVSGSMLGPDKLGLLKQGFALMIDKLNERDTVSIVTYAGRSGIALPPTRADKRALILSALESLEPGGGTNGSQGIQTAYRLAGESFIQGGTNRVLVATDGDFNMGMTSRTDLHALIERMAATGVYLTMLGFGRANPQDRTMELLADRGNGNYAFIDSAAEARRFLSRELTGTLVTIAKDVKIQVEWNPKTVRSFRLIGYENRQLEERDFNDDSKDAGEIGAGHTVTALYDIQPSLQKSDGESLGKVSIRFKAPDGDASQLVEGAIQPGDDDLANASTDFRFAAAVAAFGMVLKGSQHIGKYSLDDVARLASGALGDDPEGERSGFVALVKRAIERRRVASKPLGPKPVGRDGQKPIRLSFP